MGRILTKEEWNSIKPPFYLLTIKETTSIIYEIMEKWFVVSCSDWLYFEGNVLVFGNKSDMMVFTIWLKSEPDEIVANRKDS